MNSLDGNAHVSVNGHTVTKLPGDSIFSSVDDASDFFEGGSLGYSPASSPVKFDGLELQTHKWRVQPLAVSEVQSSFFDDLGSFPTGSVSFDNALLMQGIEHEWHSRDAICCSGG